MPRVANPPSQVEFCTTIILPPFRCYQSPGERSEQAPPGHDIGLPDKPPPSILSYRVTARFTRYPGCLKCGVAIEGNSRASPHFSQAFYCGTTMPHVACVALDLGAQRTTSTLPRPNLRAPCHHAPL